MMSEKPEDPKDLMPTERKSMWRTAEERRMSDLTRVMEWLERRRGKQQALEKHTKVAPASKAPGKEEKKAKVTKKKSKGNRQVSFSAQPTGSGSRKDGDPVRYRRLYGMEMKGKRLSIVPGNYSKEALGKSDIDIKESVVQDSTQRLMSFHRQSMADPLMLQDPVFTGRRSTILRDWVGKIPESSYDRRLKNLMDKGADPKAEVVKTLKPEEVLSCRYLRLSKNNVLTLLKLCKDAGLVVDIHPHMVESEIDAKKVFAPHPTVAL